MRVTLRVTDQRNASASRAGLGLPRRPAVLEPRDRGLAGLGVCPPVGHLLGPRGEQVVELVEGLDAAVGGLGQERFADIAVESFLFPPPLRRVGLAVDQPHAEHRARAGQPRVGERRAVVTIKDLGQAAAGDRAAQQLLAGASVLVREEPAVHQQPGMVIDDQKQPRPDRAVPAWPGNPGPGEHVADPPLVRPGRLIPAVGLRLGGQGLPVQPGAAQLRADGPLGDPHAVPVIQDRGDLRGRAARQLQPQRGGLGGQLRMSAHRPGVGPRRGLQRIQPPGSPRPQPPVDRPSGILPRRAVGMGMSARGDLPDQRTPLRGAQPVIRCLGDHRPPVHCDVLLLPVVHAACLLMPVMAGQEA